MSPPRPVDLHVEHDRDGPVVDEFEPHPRPEDAGFDRDAEVAERLAEGFVERFGLRFWRGLGEVRASSPPAAGIGEERELADDKRRATDVEQRAVEVATVVREDAQARNAAGETLGCRPLVAIGDAEQDTKAGADAGDRSPFDDDARLGDALDDRSQSASVSESRSRMRDE